MLSIQAQRVLLVVDLVFFDGLVFVVQAEKRGNPESENHAQQEENRDRCDAGYQPVGDHGKPLPIF